MSRTRLVLLYTLFATIATLSNLAAQWAVLQTGRTRAVEFSALLVGTAVGLPVKYLLDKRWIFRFESRGAAHDVRLFVLYAAMALVTTVIFWGSELGVGRATHSVTGHLLGGLIGLAVGYSVKYQLDKRLVFVERVSVA